MDAVAGEPSQLAEPSGPSLRFSPRALRKLPSSHPRSLLGKDTRYRLSIVLALARLVLRSALRIRVNERVWGV